MTEQTVTKPAETDEQGMASHIWKRRGLLAAAWAAVAAIVARQTTEPVEAGVDGDVVLGVGNSTPATTAITNTAVNGVAGLEVFCNASAAGLGLYAQGSGYGVIANNGGGTANAAAVYGFTSSADNYGVWGDNFAGVGVLGQSIIGIGIRGQIPSTSSANTIAMYGLNNSSYAGAFMVRWPSAAPSPSSAAPRVPQCRTPMAPTAGCIAWKALKAGLKISGRGSLTAGTLKSPSIPTSRPW